MAKSGANLTVTTSDKCFICNEITSTNYLNIFKNENEDMDIPLFLKKTLDKDITEQQINFRKLCMSCYETLFELNEYEKRIQNSLKHMNALKSKIKSTISKPDSLPPSPSVSTIETQQESSEFQEPNLDDEENENSQSSELSEPNVSEDETITYEYMEDQEDSKPINPECSEYPLFEMEFQGSPKVDLTNLKKEFFPESAEIEIIGVTGIESFPNFMENMKNDTDNEESPEETMLVLDDEEYSARDVFDIIEYNDDYSQVGGSKMGDDDVIEDHEDADQEDYDLKTGTSTEITVKDFKHPALPVKLEVEEYQKLLFEMIQDSYFKCTLCPPNNDEEDLYLGIDCFEQDTLGNHLASSHNFELNHCKQCKIQFLSDKTLNIHLVDQHSAKTENIAKCSECNASFSSKERLLAHQKKHTEEGKVKSSHRHACDVCNKNFTSKAVLNEHTNMHSGKRPHKCPACPKDFGSKYTLAAHMKIHSDRERDYKCSQCDKAFLNKANQITHEKTHTGERNHICSICQKAFSTQHNLDVHSIVHSGLKPFACRICDKTFARRAEIKDHERTHTGERPFTCDICGTAFAQRSNLTSHKRATHFNDKRYVCEICDKAFKRRRLMEYHIKAIHTGERPYSCTLCSSTFVYPEHFKKHQNIHTQAKRYKCEVCEKVFASRDNRNSHRFVHSEKKPYECGQCGAGFMRKPLLFAHMKNSNHPSETYVSNVPRYSQEGQIVIISSSTANSGGKDGLYLDDEDETEENEDDGEEIEFVIQEDDSDED